MPKKDPLADIKIPIGIYRKKEDYERIMKETGEDRWMLESVALVKRITKDLPNIYQRRKHIEGFGIVLAVGAFGKIMDEAALAYGLALYYSTIALCGTVVERICYDTLEAHTYHMDGTAFYDDEDGLDRRIRHGQAVRRALFAVPFRSLVAFIKEINANLDDKTESMMHEIYDIRNRYVHPTKDLEPKHDADKIINLTFRVTERLCGLNFRMTFKGDEIVQTEEFKQYLKQEAEELKRQRAERKARRNTKQNLGRIEEFSNSNKNP